MLKLEKINPVVPNISNNNVLVSKQVFRDIINVINSQTKIINILIDRDSVITEDLSNLKSSQQTLAKAIDNILGDN